MLDRRRLVWECDHAQSRLKRPRLGFTVTGYDFLDGILHGCFVSPATGMLQPIPNSEEPEYQASNEGRFRKLQLADVVTIDANSPAGEFKMAAASGMHADSAIVYVGENLAGIGVKTTAALPKDTGYTVAVYAYGSGTDQDGVLLEMFWADDQNLGGGGVGVKVMLSGEVELYKDSPNEPVYRGAVSGGGYAPGSVRGGSYARASDEYVMVRVEPCQGRFLLITTSRGGVLKIPVPWAIRRYKDDGTLDKEAEPVLPAKRWGWYVPKGAASVVAAPVAYGFPNPYAISAPYQFAETPTFVGPASEDVLSARVMPYSEDVTGVLVKEDGVTPYDRASRRFRVKLSFSAVAFVSGATGSYPRLRAMTPEPEEGPFDLSDYVLHSPIALEDGPMGASFDLILRGDCPAPFLDEAEGRPFRISLVPHPDDPSPLPPVVLVDGVGGVPEWVDGIVPAAQSIHVRCTDRMQLVREAQFSETVPFDGLAFCRPVSQGESFVATLFREGGVTNEELEDLPEITNEDGTLFRIDDTPGQTAGDWNFAAQPRQLVGDLLDEGFRMVPQYAYGLRPTVNGTRVYVVDTLVDTPPVATFYRRPEDAEADPGYQESELGGWAYLYGLGHRRIKLPKEGNVVRVNGVDPGTGKGIQAYVRDDSSADPQAPLSPGKLGFVRQIFIRKRALTTQASVNALARRVDAAIAKRQTIEPWPAMLRMKPDGSPVWRTDRVVLKQAKRDGTDSVVRVAGFAFDPRDESGGGLMDETGRVAPVAIRLAEYAGGAIVGLGGARAWDIHRLQKRMVDDGGSQYGTVERVATSAAFVNRLTP